MSSTKPFAKRPLPPPVAVPDVTGEPADVSAGAPVAPPTQSGPNAAPSVTPGAPQPAARPPRTLAGRGDAMNAQAQEAEGNSGNSIGIEEFEEMVGAQTRRIRRLLLFLGLITVTLAGLAIWWAQTRPETTTPTQVTEAIDETFASTTVPPPIGPAVFNAVIPSMVVIQTGQGPQTSIGTGVVVNANGDILTAHHVVDGEGPIRISFPDGTETTAFIANAQPDIDIALLTVDVLPQVIIPAVLGGGVVVGEPVFALGNPLGLGGSFSAGVVSGLERTMPIDEDRRLEGLIQFDAAVNPGSSGGPLVNRGGQVVGIVTALVNPTGEDFFSGIGFAVPIDQAGGAAGGPQQ